MRSLSFSPQTLAALVPGGAEMRFLWTKLDEISRRQGVPSASDNWSNDHELPWLDRMQKAVEAIPASEAEFIRKMMYSVDTTKFAAAVYDL